MTDKQHDTQQDTHGRPPGSFRDAHTAGRTGQDTGTGRRKWTQQDTHGRSGRDQRGTRTGSEKKI